VLAARFSDLQAISLHYLASGSLVQLSGGKPVSIASMEIHPSTGPPPPAEVAAHALFLVHARTRSIRCWKRSLVQTRATGTRNGNLPPALRSTCAGVRCPNPIRVDTIEVDALSARHPSKPYNKAGTRCTYRC